MEQSRGSQACGRRGRSPAELQGTTPRSPRYLAHPAPSPPQPSCALPLTSGPSRQDKRQQAEPGGAHAPGHGGSGPSRAPRSQALGHASPPARRRRVWNPLLSLRFPAQLLAIGRELRPQLCRAPPPSGGGDTPAWRGREGLPGEEPAGPLGTQAGSGDPEQPRDEDSFKVGAAWARVAGGGNGVLDSGFQELIGTPLCTAARFLCPSLC